jgi:hypothetical protein
LTVRSPVPVALSALLLLLPAASRAQDEAPPADHQLVPPAQWGKLPASAAGQKVYLEGRWHECFGDKLLLWRTPAASGFLLVDKGTPLHERLVKNLDSRNQQLKPGKSTVRVEGKAVAQGQACAVQVTRVIKLTDDMERLRARLAGLEKPDQMAALAQEATSLAERWADEELRALAQLVVQQELHARQRDLKPGDAASAEALGQRMLDVGDRDGAIQVLGQAEQTSSGAAQQRLRKRLASMGAVETHGAWMSGEQYRREEGYIDREGGWVRRELIEMEEARARELKNQKAEVGVVLVRGNGHALGKEAEAGKLARGQTMAEVHLAAGLPTSARHLDAPDPLGRPATWTQWVLEDGRRVYFLNGEAISILPASTPWPGQQAEGGN